MPTLVIHAPTSKVPPGRDFDTVIKLEIGQAYGFTPTEVDHIRPGWNVIVLNRETRPRKRADGKLRSLKWVATDPKFPPAHGCSRYDVYMDHLTRVAYDAPLPPLSVPPKLNKDRSPSLNKSGIAILW